MIISIKRSMTALAFTALLAGCNSGDKPASDADNANAVAMVNGQPISEVQFETYAQRRTNGSVENLDPAMREQIINELVNIELLAQRAESQKLHEQSPLKERLAFEQKTTLADAAMSRHLEDNPVTEETVRAEYEARKDELAGAEFKARHILVEERETAEQLITELDEGADFETLAKENSTEPGADQSGGSLGWFMPNQMVAPFSNAVQAMETGSYSSEPVETQFGWHVILLEDKRDVEPPAFEEISDRIERFLTNQRVQEYLNELRNGAEVDIKTAQPEEDIAAE